MHARKQGSYQRLLRRIQEALKKNTKQQEKVCHWSPLENDVKPTYKSW